MVSQGAKGSRSSWTAISEEVVSALALDRQQSLTSVQPDVVHQQGSPVGICPLQARRRQRAGICHSAIRKSQVQLRREHHVDIVILEVVFKGHLYGNGAVPSGMELGARGKPHFRRKKQIARHAPIGVAKAVGMELPCHRAFATTASQREVVCP